MDDVANVILSSRSAGSSFPQAVSKTRGATHIAKKAVI